MNTIIRCAIYTRQSRATAQQFSSCDAQREACAAFIGAHPGWCWNERPYDDEGKSGESLQRAGLQRLLQDVRAGAIDRVVVHRLDRLSRRLVDCATILSELQERRVPLVVVTSPELGTSAMQSLMANILASFVVDGELALGQFGGVAGGVAKVGWRSSCARICWRRGG
ncbi:MAG: hypothetical protein RLY70_3500 [Planctomycetota bacterium]